jgi:hypothetical protein
MEKKVVCSEFAARSWLCSQTENRQRARFFPAKKWELIILKQVNIKEIYSYQSKYNGINPTVKWNEVFYF